MNPKLFLAIPLMLFLLVPTSFAQTPETVTGFQELPEQRIETFTYDKFQDGYTWELTEDGFLYKSWDADRLGSNPVPKPDYPQVTENYTIEEIGEDTFTYSTHTPYISDKHEWKPYILGEDDQVVQVQVNGGKFVFDKLQGAVTIFDDQGIIIDSDSYTVRTALLNSDVWSNLSVNDGIVTTTVVESGESVTVSFVKENDEGLFKTEYVIGNGKVKTTAYFTNYIFDNNKFAFTQTINLPDSIITLNDDIIDLNDYVGQSFPREILEQNEDLVLEIKELHYNSGLGFENLWSVNVTSPTKVSLDYANVSQTQTNIGETVELDPTWATSLTASKRVYTSTASSTYCDGTLTMDNYHETMTPSINGSSRYCMITSMEYDVSAIPDTAIITNVSVVEKHNVWASAVSASCEYRSNTSYQPSTGTSSQLWGSAKVGTTYATDPACITTNNSDYTVNLNAQANTDLQSQLTSDWFGINWTFDTFPNITDTGTGISDVYAGYTNLSVTYTQPPTTPTNVTATFNSPNVDLAWSASDSNSPYVESSVASTTPIVLANSTTCSGTTPTTPTFGLAGKIGNALSFNGVCDVIQWFNPASSGGNVSISTWLYADAGTSSRAMIPWGASNGFYNYLILNGQWSHAYQNNIVVPNGLYSEANAFAPNQWNHMVITIDSNKNTKLYVNGVSKLLYTYPGAASGTLTTVGSSTGAFAGWSIGGAFHTSGAYAYPFGGEMDELASWHKVLTQTEVNTLYNGGAGNVASSVSGSNDMEYYLPMDDTSLPLDNMAVLTDPITLSYNVVRDGTTISTGLSGTTYSDTPSIGSTYAYQVNSQTSYGTSSNSTTQNMDLTLPTAPTGLTATFNNPNVDLSWVTPSSSGGSPITGYKIEHSTDGITWGTITTTTNTNVSYSHTTPTLGSLNYYKISAVNGYGSGSVSNVANTMAGVPPDAPTGVSTSIVNPNPNPLDVTVSWSSPSNVGSGSLTGFEVYRDGSLITTTGLVTSYIDVTPNTGTYVYSAKAVSTHGTSILSNTSSITTPTIPSADAGVTLTIDNPNATPFDITVSLVAPSSNGGSAITGYNLSSSPDDITYTQVATGVTTPQTITVGSAGTWYFKSQAINNVGTAALGSAVSVTTPTVPLTPAAPTLSIGDPNGLPLDVTVSWVAPGDGGSSIIDYELYRSTDDVTFTSIVTGITTLTHTDTAPNAGTFYYKIVVRNNVGNSLQSLSSSVTTPTIPDTITDLVGTDISDVRIDLSWSAPNNGGSSIIDYDIMRDSVKIDTVSTVTYSDVSLTPKTVYLYEVFARNNVGFSLISNQDSTTTQGIPDAPVVTVSQNSITSLDLSWSTPQDYNSPIIGYKIEIDTGSGYTTLVANTGDVTTTYTAIGLTPISEYFFKVSAINAYGTGLGGIDSNWTNPTAPTGLIVIPDSTTTNLELYWDVNVSATGYKIEKEIGIGNGWATLVANTGNTNTAYQDTGLTDNIFYNYRISTVTPVGNSIPSGTYSQTTFHLPDPVISLTANDGLTGTIDLTWSAPVSPYGSIIGYTVYSVTAPGVTATATATLSTTLDQINTITIVDGGTLYATTPTVTISPPGGVEPFVNATATATLTGGVVTGVTITNNGNGYNTIPTVTISPPAVNTTVITSTTLTPIVSDTGSSSVNYTVGNINPATDYSFAVAPITIHGSTILGAAIVTSSPDEIFEGLVINIPNETNPDQVPILFEKNIVGNNTDLLIKYDSSLNLTCDISSPFTNTTTSYPNLSETPISGSMVSHTMTFENSDNNIIDVYCYDVNNNSTNGQQRISQSIIPLKTQMDEFSDNTFGTGSTFAAVDLVTLIVVIVGMIGFNRKNPAVGLAIMGGLLGILSVLQIITMQATAIGGFILIVFLAIIMGLKNR